MMQRTAFIVLRAIYSILALALFMLAGCSRDPRMGPLRDTVDLMSGIIRSRVLKDAVRDADPQMRPSTAARAALSGGVTANFPQPSGEIPILEGDRASQPWCVILVGDDANKQVRVEGYGDDLTEPLIVEKIDFPPN
jgi:hypothetical protein